MDSHHRDLEQRGYVFLQDVMDANLLSATQQRVEELLADEAKNPGADSRWETDARRLNNLADQGAVFWRAITCGPVVALVKSVLGPDIKLSSITVRSVNANSKSRQPLHVDMNLLPDHRGYCICNALWSTLR